MAIKAIHNFYNWKENKITRTEEVEIVSINRFSDDRVSVSYIGPDNTFHSVIIFSFTLDLEFKPIKEESQETALRKLKKWARNYGDTHISRDRLITIIEKLENETN